MEERFTEEAVALAFASMLEKQAAAKENTEELPDLDMMEQKDVIKEQEPDVDEPEMERAEKVVSITRRR